MDFKFLLPFIVMPVICYGQSVQPKIEVEKYVHDGYATELSVATINQGVKLWSSQLAAKNTVFPIASITKVFTTLALAQQVLAGKVKLSDAAQSCMPKSMLLPTYHGTPIRVIDLATHMSGLPSSPLGVGRVNPYKDITEKRLATLLLKMKLLTKPGTNYEYSDLGMAVLGQCIATVAAKPYRQVINENILQPLHMDNTFFEIPQKYSGNVAQGYQADKPVAHWQFNVMAPAGGLYSNAVDLVRFMQANMGLLKTSLYPAMQLSHKVQFPEGVNARNLGLPKGAAVQTTLGWNVYKNLIWKTGNIPGSSSFIGFRTDKPVGVVVLSNASNIVYTNNLALHLLDPAAYPLLPRYKSIKIATKKLAEYAGHYKTAAGTIYQFTPQGDYLLVVNLSTPLNLRTPFAIYPLSNNAFFAKVANSVFSFSRDKKGRVTGFHLNESGQVIKASRLGLRSTSSINSLTCLVKLDRTLGKES